MAKIEINKVELVWPSKYNEDGTLKEVPRVSLPFQVIERVNESRATREAKKAGIQRTLFDVWEGKEGDTFEQGWRNKLIWGDNLLVMGSLLEKFAGKIDLIYIDPPFATGADFSFRAQIGETGEDVLKKHSVIEEKAYRDTWGSGLETYLEMMHPRLVLMRKLLSDSGAILIHIGPGVSQYVKVLADEVFGTDNFRNEIIWERTYNTGSSKARMKGFPVNHDSILYYQRTSLHTPNPVYEPYSEKYIKQHYRYQDSRGRYRLEVLATYSKETYERLKREGRLVERETSKYPYYKQYLDEMPGVLVSDVWCGLYLGASTPERTGYDTQKPEVLLERIVKACSSPGDLVADFFCGSGTTLAVAEKLGRRWIGCDLSRWAIHVTRKRLLDIANCKPFEVLNLGKYERQYWQGVTFGEKKDKSRAEQVLYEYLAFILKLYGAQPVAGMQHLHGKKGKAMVHIGAVDAPVTIDEINAAIDECVEVGQKELHVLGWEWEMGLAGPNNDVRRGSPMHEIARQKGVKLVLLQIPREVMEEQAVEKGDVKFFELAYFEIEIHEPKERTIQVELKDFASPNMDELIPEEVRAKIKKWSDYIDYWAIDWDFRNDTFMQGWVAYRTRKNRKLPLVSDPHTYDKPGKYRILIKVIDIFGNDTSQAYDVEVK